MSNGKAPTTRRAAAAATSAATKKGPPPVALVTDAPKPPAPLTPTQAADLVTEVGKSLGDLAAATSPIDEAIAALAAELEEARAGYREAAEAGDPKGVAAATGEIEDLEARHAEQVTAYRNIIDGHPVFEAEPRDVLQVLARAKYASQGALEASRKAAEASHRKAENALELGRRVVAELERRRATHGGPGA